MHSIILQTANIVRNKYRYEIDGCMNAFEFFKAKFNHDKAHIKLIHDTLYKKVKK